MKKILTIIAFAFVAVTASAQFDFGLKGGVNITHMSFSSDVISSSNQSGFYVGPTMKFSVPLVGIGFDASLLYDQRQGKVDEETVKQQQIVLPINLRYQIGLGDLASILLFAGPQFGLNVGSDIDEIDWEWKSTNLSVNVGAGVMLLNHLQVTANYNIACGTTGNFSLSSSSNKEEGKFSSWQIGLAYYF